MDVFDLVPIAINLSLFGLGFSAGVWSTYAATTRLYCQVHTDNRGRKISFKKTQLPLLGASNTCPHLDSANNICVKDSNRCPYWDI